MQQTAQTLENQIRSDGCAVLRRGHIAIQTSKSHLAVDVEVIRSDVENSKGERVLALRVELRLREPVTIDRDKKLSVPGGGAVISEDPIIDVTTEAQIAKQAADYAIELVQRIAEAVEMVRE